MLGSIDSSSKFSHHICNHLEKNVKFEFEVDCVRACNCLKEKLVLDPIIMAPNWALPFELMCDTSCFTLGTVLGQIKDKFFSFGLLF